MDSHFVDWGIPAVLVSVLDWKSLGFTDVWTGGSLDSFNFYIVIWCFVVLYKNQLKE
jgi:hypothetical protein